MNTKGKVRTIAGVLLIGVLLVLGGIWWVNGREDTWFYFVCAVIALTSVIPLLSKKVAKKSEDNAAASSSAGVAPMILASDSDSSDIDTSPGDSGSTTDSGSGFLVEMALLQVGVTEEV